MDICITESHHTVQSLAYSTVCGLHLFDKMYVLVLRQVYHCLTGVINVSSSPSFKDLSIQEWKCCI